MTAACQAAPAAHDEHTPVFHMSLPLFSICVYRGGC